MVCGAGPQSKVMAEAPASARATSRAASVQLPGVPVRLLTSGQSWWLTPEEDKAWRHAHKQIVASIPGAELIIAEESDHLIPDKQPELVIAAVAGVGVASRSSSFTRPLRSASHGSSNRRRRRR